MAKNYFDAELIKKYNLSGPRYTSYPTALEFNEKFTTIDYLAAAKRVNESDKELSLYFHIPFCDTICFYCACNKIWTKRKDKTPPYMQRLYKEIAMQGKLFDKTKIVKQLHWGGGTPTFISMEQMGDLMQHTKDNFNLLDDDSGEYSIEIDPREANAKTVSHLRKLGFNRMSLGLQDFNPKVQVAVNRIQSEEETFSVLHAARKENFKSISIDLIYGLPFQTKSSFMVTLDKILSVSPDRLAIFNYAHMPHLFPSQKQMDEKDMPSPSMKLEILHATIEKLTENGYEYIGMDHFAKKDDELILAQNQGKLYRNFQGYSTHSDCHLVAMGATSISLLDNTYSQNYKKLKDYYNRIDSDELAIFRGVELSQDDLIRRDLISQLICNFKLDKKLFSTKWDIDFNRYFSEELPNLDSMKNDGLLSTDENSIVVHTQGRLLIRNICMVFDAYIKHKSKNSFSKVI
jgi:oxygen-independent coproporphyrinogen-3 oxidase